MLGIIYFVNLLLAPPSFKELEKEESSKIGALIDINGLRKIITVNTV